MGTSNPVLSGLIRKRQQVAADLAAAETRFRHLASTMEAVDITIRLLKPDIDFKAVKVRPAPRREEGNERVGTSRAILTAVREAGQPLLQREITRRVMQARGLDIADKGLARVIHNRIGTSLRGLRKREQLATSAEADGLHLWVV